MFARVGEIVLPFSGCGAWGEVYKKKKPHSDWAMRGFVCLSFPLVGSS